MKSFRVAIVILFGSVLGHAALTTDQKIADMKRLAAVYAKEYAPYEWKRAVIGFDAMDIKTWLERAANTKDDLDFYELCVEYVASLNDAHDVFTIPSDFVARLGFFVDLYDGKPLIDNITRSVLPAAQYPFQIGDELISVDGKLVADLLPGLLKYEIAANVRSTTRLAAELLTFRPQSLMPHAHEVGDSAAVVIQRQSGALETYTIPWVKTGTAILDAGSPVSPSASVKAERPARAVSDAPYMDLLNKLGNARKGTDPVAVLNFGSLAPIYALPAGFTLRLGQSVVDEFVTGTYKSGGYTIGYMRIPSYGPASTSNALAQLQREVAFFQQNTDGVVIDEMRNPGGSVCYGETVASFFMTDTWRPLGFQLRATPNWVGNFAFALQSAQDQGAPPWVINLYTAYLKEVQQALAENRGMTGPLPLCGESFDLRPATNRAGKSIAYTKPLIVLIDEMSASGADAFPATMQDNGRGVLVGYRTMGAGGSVSDVDGTIYSAGATRVTQSLMNRKNPVVTSDFPATFYVENVGVRPDIEIDYMTKDNLLQRGKPFTDAFTQVMVDQIKKGQ